MATTEHDWSAGNKKRIGKRVGVSFGCLAPPIEEQLEKQGFRLPNADAFQAHAERLDHLRVASILTESESHRARKRLLKAIVKAVEVL